MSNAYSTLSDSFIASRVAAIRAFSTSIDHITPDRETTTLCSAIRDCCNGIDAILDDQSWRAAELRMQDTVNEIQAMLDSWGVSTIAEHPQFLPPDDESQTF